MKKIKAVTRFGINKKT